eukprot:CAMPEP_0202861980 /NCGR_PEP_ID=MMETSP1391-20130828/3191_1 /ASSEMBLY_ACC=CAM_ASM_000867 /TAXON_ID=1034604 /ORGANISM="Chlamydomonas leiostraca, Strain SAG 11-49" /LENGTH=93 /DNA_ID=CAMNT_0049541451 /DNA_START=418 /DNA_END=698 /DNA_ORIENTATION=-
MDPGTCPAATSAQVARVPPVPQPCAPVHLVALVPVHAQRLAPDCQRLATGQAARGAERLRAAWGSPLPAAPLREGQTWLWLYTETATPRPATA